MKKGPDKIKSEGLSSLYNRSGSNCPDKGSARFHAYLRALYLLVAAGPWVLFSFLTVRPALSLAAPGDLIVNNAIFTANGSISESASCTVTEAATTPRTDAAIEFLKYAPGLAGATPVNVTTGAYRQGGASGPFVNLPSPVPAGSETPIDLSNPVRLAPAAFFIQGEPIFIRVRDLDQNLDNNLRETVISTLTNPDTGDNEAVRLTETGPDTGVFVGYIQSGNGIPSNYNGTLTVSLSNESFQSNLTASYTDIADSRDHVSCSALVDPYGIIFNSSTGEPVDGVWITLIDVSTGLPATVYGDDGVSPFPARIETGSSPTDASGRRYDLPSGGFRFPFVAPGNYRFEIDPLTGFAFPSTVSDTTLQTLAGGPFTLVTGSRLEQFTVNPGPSIRIDIPIDPLAAGQLWLRKSAGKDTVSIGDFLPYELQLKNGSASIANVTISDTLPLGFRYRKGSTRVDGVSAPNPAISADGRSLTFSIGDIAADASVAVRYVVEVAAGARLGTATNLAVAMIDGSAGSNRASATVQVKSDFLSTKSVLMGQVIAGACGAPDKEAVKGVGGIRIFLEDGTFVDTDKRGMFHFEGVTTGSHVVQLDLDSLPDGYNAVPCEENTRFSGTAYSQFVDLQGGSIWRVDFHVAQANKGSIEEAAPPSADDKKDVAGPHSAGERNNDIKEEEGILSPCENCVMARRIHSVRICLKTELTPHLFLDGNEVPSERIGFSMKDPKSGKAIYSYIGVDFGEKGRHTLELKGTDPFGIARVTKKIEIVRSGEIAAVRLKSAEGNVADGRSPVKFQLELLDSAGQVIPSEMDLELRGGTLKPLTKEGDSPGMTGDGSKDRLSPDPAGVQRVHMDGNGYAFFQPVNSGGLYTVVLGVGKVSIEAETYVKPQMRDWILVGIGEGTVGYDALSGHMENLTEAGEDDRFYDDERLAFYAKGKIKGEWLITMAYDSAKHKGEVGNTGLFQTIDPNTYYTLYGDATEQQYDAASARKLYLKIERDRFYAMFGDFDTGLTVTELSRYSRRLNGFKSEFQGKNLEASIFATETPQAYVRDEIRGDGTSGLYHLSRKNIVPNSDKITIETRDRFHSEVIIESRSMSRFTDYSIDNDTGAVFFKEPIRSRDDSFNPIYIVAEYETEGRDTRALTYGGRIGAKLLDNRIRTGFTHIHEGQATGNADSYGVDASWQFAKGSALKGEFAHTDSRFGKSGNHGNAFLAEIDHHGKRVEAKAYFRQQDEGFGLGQQNGSETGTRKMGLDAAYRVTDYLGIGGRIYRQYNLTSGGVQDVIEGKTTFSTGPYSAWLGGRHANDSLKDGSDRSSDQLIFGGSLLTLNKRLTLRAEHEQSLGHNENADFPTRTTFGADFKMTRKVTLFAQQEITSGNGSDTNSTNVGMKSTPWEGGSVNTSFGHGLNEETDRMFALFGLKQTLKITDKWSIDAGMDRSQTIREKRYYRFNSNVPSASGENQDFTAFSVGTTYTEKKWNASSRLEVRTSDCEDKWGIIAAYVGEPTEGFAWSARLQLLDTKTAAGLHTMNGDLRLGTVYRPLRTRWILLDRLDILYDREHGGSGGSFNIDNWRVVNNFNGNFKMDNRVQVSLQYGAKYVLESIDGTDYSGYTDLMGVEGRYDLTRKWDLGLRGSVLHSWSAGQLSYSAGLSIGYNIFNNAWVSLGYNLVGFADRDFSKSDYTAQGPYVRFRFKFDQNSVKDAISWIRQL